VKEEVSESERECRVYGEGHRMERRKGSEGEVSIR